VSASPRALASSIAARSVHSPAAVAHVPSPGLASGASPALVTVKVVAAAGTACVITVATRQPSRRICSWREIGRGRCTAPYFRFGLSSHHTTPLWGNTVRQTTYGRWGIRSVQMRTSPVGRSPSRALEDRHVGCQRIGVRQADHARGAERGQKGEKNKRRRGGSSESSSASADSRTQEIAVSVGSNHGITIEAGNSA
jgi:hypothetical protein